MTRFLAFSCLAGAMLSSHAIAQSPEPVEAIEASAAAAEDDTLVRLPGTGEVKSEITREKLQADKLKPGGGLLASFDADEDGRVTRAELEAGIEAAFKAADTKEDGWLTAFEQQDWANSLPTRDDSLTNPVRFDPNLDRRVTFAEFSSVITNLWADYREEGYRELRVSSLRSTRDERRDERTGSPEEYRGALPGEVPADTDAGSGASLSR